MSNIVTNNSSGNYSNMSIDVIGTTDLTNIIDTLNINNILNSNIFKIIAASVCFILLLAIIFILRS